jgi:hypothetical protein
MSDVPGTGGNHAAVPGDNGVAIGRTGSRTATPPSTTGFPG